MREWINDIHQGHAAEVLRQMPESSVHLVMCSPPYYGLRDYGDETITVWGGSGDCDHEWVSREVYQDSPIREGGSASPGEHETTEPDERREVGRCQQCGARREQLGLEESLSDYIQDLVAIGDEIRRVLRDDGSWWLNLGDTYSGGGGAAGKPDGWDDLHDDSNYPDSPPARSSRFGKKNKMLVPHRTAIALQEAGWVVRQDVIWAKENCMPESVTDRLSTTKEYIFHLTADTDYWFNLDAIREPHAEASIARSGRHDHAPRGYPGNDHTLDPDKFVHPNGKNPGDVLNIGTKPFPDAHFAVYPPELCEKPIRASCPKDGVVLDPFAGAGTTCLVAKQLGRRFIGIDLNPKYVAMAQGRVGVEVDRPELLTDRDQATLADGGFTKGEVPCTPDAEGGSDATQ